MLDDTQIKLVENCKRHAEEGGYLFEHIRRDILNLVAIIEESEECHVTDTDWKKRMEQGT